ncbi:hypothetical protein MHK_001439 [Candidatus Magnetomorum sp. HK-1]|nr:hypothetical protein MHK_001439 [Candidatus Magnetomorum sp. HK-1]
MNNLQTINGVFGKSIDGAEKIYKSISNVPFDILETIDPIKSGVKLARNVHDTVTDGVYSTIRNVHNEIGAST